MSDLIILYVLELKEALRFLLIFTIMKGYMEDLILFQWYILCYNRRIYGYNQRVLNVL